MDLVKFRALVGKQDAGNRYENMIKSVNSLLNSIWLRKKNKNI